MRLSHIANATLAFSIKLPAKQFTSNTRLKIYPPQHIPGHFLATSRLAPDRPKTNEPLQAQTARFKMTTHQQRTINPTPRFTTSLSNVASPPTVTPPLRSAQLLGSGPGINRAII